MIKEDLPNTFLAGSVTNNRQEKIRFIIRILSISTLATFSIETLLMVLLEFILQVPKPLIWFLDGLILITLLFPLNYFFIVKPVVKRIEEHQRTNSKTQLALTESEHRFRAVFNQTFQQVSLLDTSGNIVFANQTALDFAGIDFAAINGKPYWEMPFLEPNPGEPNAIKKSVDLALAGQTIRGVHRMRSSKNQLVVMDITLKPMQGENGQIAMLICEARDISDRVRYEEVLQRNQREINRLYQAEINARELAETMRSAALALSASLK